MKKTPYFFISAIILTLIFLISTTAHARMEFNSFINLSEEYNDNIYLDAYDEEDDWITTIEPGFSLDYDSHSLVANLNYSMLFRFFSHNTSENETDLKDVSRGSGSFTLFPNNNFNLNVAGDISRVIMDDRESSSDENDFINKATLYHYTVNPSYDLRLGSVLNLALDYYFEQAKYEDIEDTIENPYDANDYIEHRAEARLIKTLSSSTEIYIGYVYTDFQEDRSNRYDENEDYSSNDVIAGFVHPFGSRLFVRAMGGMSWVDYVDDDQDDPEGSIWDIGIDYNFSESLQASLDYINDFANSVSNGLSDHKEVRFSLTYSRRITITSELYGTKNKYEGENFGYDDLGEYFSEDDYSDDQGAGAIITFTLPIGQRFDLDLTTDYSHYKYKYSEPGQDDEKVNRYGFGTSLNYEFNHLTASLSYNYRRNNSDVIDNENDYTNNIAMLDLGWNF